MPLADTLNRKPGDILKSDDWNVIIKEIDRKINRDGADTLKGPLTITEALKVNSSVIISGNLSVTNVLEIGDPPFAGNTGGNRDWMQKGIKINWDSDSLFIGLKNEGTNRKDAVIAWGDDPQDDLRFVNVLAGGEVQGKELMRIKPSGNVGIGTNNPIASLDIASASRTGTHPTAVKGLYITGDFNADNDGVEFRHSNATQGIGFGFNTIYAAGSNANQDLGLKPKGTGEVKVSGSLSVSGIVKAQALTLSQSGGQSSGMASFMSKNPEPPYINWYHSRSGADQDLKRYGYIQAGDDGIKEFRFVAENGANFKFSGGNLTVSGDLSVTGSVSFGSQVRQMLNLWSTGYGIGIQNGTQYFRSDRNFAWYQGGSHNDAELNAGGGTSLMTLHSNGNLSVSGGIYAANSDIYFTKTDHNHTGIGNTSGYAAIENDGANYEALMILGRTRGDKARYVNLYDNVEVNGNLQVNQALSYQSQRQFSSRKLKKNILDISAEEAVQSLAQLNPVKYNLKADKDNNLHLGFIAEDVPDLVASRDRQTISNDHIVALLTKVIKEQEKRLLELAEKVETLEKKS
ncbi:phage tail Collar [Microcystis aeruginosa NIES-3804]|uniref:Phage tail Collar n=1 Tax=Microcystis aeruginosa NIES-3804 TaxID=2517783 RepID=A0A6H9G4B6_MICAE|nr:tail fiber domain-containing protein [Microcystis aeruginosa]GCL50228.1 phage tail Collar [Microcystis aeruginosa NIES-3804]